MRETGVESKTGKSFSLGELAEIVGASLKGDPSIRIYGLRPLEDTAPDALSFIVNPRYSQLLDQCRAAALIAPPALADVDFPLLIAETPYLAYAKAAQLFYEPPFLAEGAHPTASIAENCGLGADVRIGALSQIGAGSCIGARTRIYGGVYLGADVRVGEDCILYPGVTIMDGCLLGDRVTVHSGTVIGSDGFGYAQDKQGRHYKIPQVGVVQIDDDVEIGANCAVDRAAFGKTWIQRGTKIDNLVQIAHNVVVGEHSVLISQVGVSGSVRLGRHVVLAGQAGIAGHIEIGDGARVGAKSGVAHSIKAGEDMIGIPAMPQKEWLRSFMNIKRLSSFREDFKRLETRVRELEQALNERKT